MTPVDAAAEVLGWSIAGGLILLALVQLKHWLVEGSSRIGRPRPHYITDRELELTGPDYRVHTEDYFRKWSRRKQIVKGICDVD